MRVLHLIDSGGLYGAEAVLLSLAEEQLRHGHSAEIFSAGVPGEAEKALEIAARDRGIPLRTWRMEPGLNPRGGREVVRHVLAQGYDVLHSHGYKFNVLLAAFCRRQRATPGLVTTLHGYSGRSVLTRSGLYQALDRALLWRFDRIVVVAERMLKDPIIRMVAGHRVQLIRNGLGAGQCNWGREVDGRVLTFMDKHWPVLLAIGRLSSEKGHERLLRAFRKLEPRCPGAGLVMLGEGSLRDRLERVAEELGIRDRVLMPGYRENAARYLAYADVFVLPSKTEGLPMVLLEAALVGVPVIASDVGDVGAVLHSGGFGRLTDRESVESLANELAYVTENIEVERQRADRARSKVQAEFGVARMAKEYHQLYATMLAPTGPQTGASREW